MEEFKEILLSTFGIMLVLVLMAGAFAAITWGASMIAARNYGIGCASVALGIFCVSFILAAIIYY